MTGKKVKEILEEYEDTEVNQTGYNLRNSNFREMNKSSQQLEKEYDEEIKIRRAACSAFEVAFAERFVTSGNAGEAARLAGSKASKLSTVGANTLKRPHVAAYVDVLMRKATMRATLKASDILDMMRRVYDKSMEAGNFKEANIAARNLADSTGMTGKYSGTSDGEANQSKEKQKRAEEDRKDEILNKIREHSAEKAKAVLKAV